MARLIGMILAGVVVFLAASTASFAFVCCPGSLESPPPCPQLPCEKQVACPTCTQCSSNGVCYGCCGTRTTYSNCLGHNCYKIVFTAEHVINCNSNCFSACAGVTC